MTPETKTVCTQFLTQSVGIVKLAVVDDYLCFALVSDRHRLFAVFTVNYNKPAVDKRSVLVDVNSVFIGTTFFKCP